MDTVIVPYGLTIVFTKTPTRVQGISKPLSD